MPRYLGQHFLINKSAIQKIVDALDLQKGETVIEIGPGEGALTLPLSEKCAAIGCKIVAIEKDPELVESSKYKVVSNVQLISGDALKVLPRIFPDYLLPTTNYKVVGNIPYYITGKLLRVLGELDRKPELIVLTIQKEVAERAVAQPPRMNLLAAATQIWSKPSIIGRLKPKDFEPPPKVDSAIIKIIPNLRRCERLRLDEYYRAIKVIFKQPRKTLLNNLSTGLNKDKTDILEVLKKMGLSETVRPQNLDLEALQNLSQKLFTF